MIELLTERIEAVCPIYGVADQSGGQYRIDYKDDATEAQIEAAEAIAQAWPLLSAKAARIEQMRAECEATIYGGFSSSVLGGLHTYSSKDQDQQNLAGSVQMAEILNEPVPYVCVDESGLKIERMHTVAQIKQLFLEGGRRKQALMFHFHTLRRQVEAAGTVAEVEAIAWSEPED